MEKRRDSKGKPTLRVSKGRVLFHLVVGEALFFMPIVIAIWFPTTFFLIAKEVGVFVFAISMFLLPLSYLGTVMFISRWLRRPPKNAGDIHHSEFRETTFEELSERLDRLRTEAVSQQQKLCVHFMGGQPKSFYEKLEKPGVIILLRRCLAPRALRFIPAWEAYFAVGPELDLWTQVIKPSSGCSMIRVCPLPENVEALFDDDQSRGLAEIERAFVNRSIQFDFDPRVVVFETGESKTSG